MFELVFDRFPAIVVHDLHGGDAYQQRGVPTGV
jgi:hypothetical protein